MWLSASGVGKWLLEFSPNLKRWNFSFTQFGESIKQRWPGPISEVLLTWHRSHRPHFPHQRGRSRGQGTGAG